MLRKTGHFTCHEQREAVGNSLLSEALQYAAGGWHVLPLHTPKSDGCSCGKIDCTSAGKHPRTASGLKQASKSVETIRRWWGRWPEANIGIATGPESGLCVLDVDGEEGQTALRELEAWETLHERSAPARDARDQTASALALTYTSPFRPERTFATAQGAWEKGSIYAPPVATW